MLLRWAIGMQAEKDAIRNWEGDGQSATIHLSEKNEWNG